MLINSLREVPVPAIEHFVFDEALRHRLKIWMSPDHNWLLDGRIEEGVPERNLILGVLNEHSPDPPIIKERGGARKAAINLAHLVWLIEDESLPKDTLLFAYIFVKRFPWALEFHGLSSSGEWRLLVFPVDYPGCRHIDDRFLLG